MNRLWVGLLVLVATVTTVRADDAEAKAVKTLYDIIEKKDGSIHEITRDETQPGRPVVFIKLYFGQGEADEAMAEVARLKHLRRVEIHRYGPTEKMAIELAKLPDLEELLSDYSHVSSEGLKALAGCKKLTTIELSHLSVKEADLKELSALKGVSRLRFSGDSPQQTTIPDDGLKAISEMENLTHLELRQGDITPVGLAHLKGCKKLTSLDLRQTPLNLIALKELATLKPLTSLDLRHTELSGRGMKLLAPLANLTELQVGGLEEFDDEELKALAPLKRLERLDLSGTKVTNAGLKHLTAFPDLTALDLGAIEVSDDGLKAVMACKKLTELRFNDEKLTDDGFKQLATIKKLTLLQLGSENAGRGYHPSMLRLRGEMGLLHTLPFAFGKDGARPTSADTVVRLKLDESELRDDIGEYLEHLTAFKSLTELDLAEFFVEDADLKHVAKFTKLRRLNLSKTQVTNDGLKTLAPLKELVELNLDETKVRGGPDLVGFKNLTRLSLLQTPISDEALEQLGTLRELTDLTVTVDENADDGLKALSGLPELTSLRVHKAELTAAGLKHLAALKKLTVLRFDVVQLGDKHLESLSSLTGLHELTMIRTDLNRKLGDFNRVPSAEAEKKLRAALPNCRVVLIR